MAQEAERGPFNYLKKLLLSQIQCERNVCIIFEIYSGYLETGFISQRRWNHQKKFTKFEDPHQHSQHRSYWIHLLHDIVPQVSVLSDWLLVCQIGRLPDW